MSAPDAAKSGLDSILEEEALGKAVDRVLLARLWGWVAPYKKQVLLTLLMVAPMFFLELAPAWIVVVIVGREFAVSGMRSVAAARGIVMGASIWGKYKTVSQVVAITLLILTHSIERWLRLENLGTVMLWIVMLLALISMCDHFMYFMRSVDLKEES